MRNEQLLRTRAIQAICAQFVATGKCAATGYTATVEENLIAPVSEECLTQFGQGSGSELRHKMRAVYSSSALALNNFGAWREGHLDELTLAGLAGFDCLCFEKKCRMGLGGTPPNLDLLLKTTGGQILAIESKFLEILTPHQAGFSASYDRIQDFRRQSGWFRQLEVLRGNPGLYRHLDAAQLIKHYLGLSHTYKGRCTLVYLYWKPINWATIPTYRRHDDEIAAFAAAVAGSTIDFIPMSYLDLWQEWREKCHSAFACEHLKKICDRYQIAI